MTQPPNTAHSSLPTCPFVAGSMISDARLFVGRKDVLQSIVSRMTGALPTSINIVGKRRIGRSSLLYHFFQTWEERLPQPERYVVIYLSLQEALCRKEDEFYGAVAQELLKQARVQRTSALAEPLKVTPLDRQTFSQACQKWKDENVLPVLCFDEFEELLEQSEEFDDGFYNNLRSLMNKSALMLVITSRELIQQYAKKKRLTSDFFNVGLVEPLEDLTEEEAADLVRLPASTVPNTQAALSLDEQRKARKWGGRHPYLLQLAGLRLCEARQQGKDAAWAKKRFDEGASNVPQPQPRFTLQKWRRAFYNVFVAPVRLGQLARGTSGETPTLVDAVIGYALIIAPVLLVLGVLSPTQLWDFLKELLG